MQTDRYDYSPIVRRAPLKWPNDARIALMVAPNIEFFHIDKAIPGAASSQLPDVTGYALRDYGSRVGVFRMMEVLGSGPPCSSTPTYASIIPPLSRKATSASGNG